MSRTPLVLSLLAFVALGAALIARVPLGASPDEAAHWQYVEFLVSNRALPVFGGAVPPAPGYEFHQPPLYYALVAPGWAVLPPGAQNYWARLISLLCGAATLVFIWKSARLLAPDERAIAVLATALGALSPLHLGVSAGANNDALAGLWSAALFWCGARALLRGAGWREAALMGVFVGLGALTKNTVLVVAFVALAALLWARPAPDAPPRAVNLLIALALATVIAGAWWARNVALYGDPLALGAFGAAASAVSPGMFAFEGAGIPITVYLRRMVWLIFLTAWGFFGGPNTAENATRPFAGPVVGELWLAPLMLVCALAPLASALGLSRLARDEEAAPRRSVWWFWGLGIALIALAWMQFAVAHVAGGQARYLHPALLPACVLGALGWRALWGTGRAFAVASWTMAAVLLALTALNLLRWQTLV